MRYTNRELFLFNQIDLRLDSLTGKLGEELEEPRD